MSAERHHSFHKIVRVCGMGDDALRVIPVDGALRLDLAALGDAVRADRVAGRLPLMVVGTAGTTGAGAIDPLPALADAGAESGAWFLVDAAWGGTAAQSPVLRAHLAGGRVWISELALRGELVPRACVTSWRTTDADLDVLVSELARALDGA